MVEYTESNWYAVFVLAVELGVEQSKDAEGRLNQNMMQGTIEIF